MNTVGYEEPHASNKFAACPVCEGHFIGDVIQVMEIGGRLYQTGR